jgi:hypothetical protein
MKTYNSSHTIISSIWFNQVGTQLKLQQHEKHSHKSCKIQNIRKQVTGKINEEKCKAEILHDKKWKLETGQGFTCS